MPNAQDTAILRELAKRYMEVALSPEQREKERLWILHNTGHGERPMVLIDQLPWHEMDVDGSLICKVSDPYWRGVEWGLRTRLYQHKYMPADMLLPPYILYPHVLEDPGFRGFGLGIQEEIRRTDAANSVVSHAFIKQIADMDDLEKIKPTRLCANSEAEECTEREAHEIFDGIAPVCREGIIMHLGLWDTISMWQSVEECYYMLLDEPELLHAMMERMTNITLDWLRDGNEQGLFDTASGICHCSHTIREPFSAHLTNRPGTTQNSWAFGLAQLFSSVSPDVTREFELPYMKRLFTQFGDIYYGCCEKLDDRLDVLAELPNVRKLSCSPWSDPNVFAERMPDGVIMSNKPNPALVAVGDFDEMRRQLKNTIEAAKRNNRTLELILKDNSSVHGHPERLWEFSRLALEIVS